MRKSDLRPSIAEWLHQYLSQRYRQAEIIVEETPRRSIASFLVANSLISYFPEVLNHRIMVDVCGAAMPKNDRHEAAYLAIASIKVKTISLPELCTFLGCAAIVRPSYAFIVSPKGWSDSVQRLVHNFRRMDILEYGKGKQIVVAKWNIARASIQPDDLLVPESL